MILLAGSAREGRYLRRRRGKSLGAFALTEPGRASPADMTTRAVEARA
jgi:alkylation response protein AidB-like acyl-CoA dehydrogenase